MKRPYFSLTVVSATALALSFGVLPAAHAQGQPGFQRGQGGGFGGFGRMGGGFMNSDPSQNSRLQLLQRPDVRTELHITTKQQEDMRAEQQKAGEAMRALMPDRTTLQNLSPEERRAKFQGMREQMQSAMRTAGEEMQTKVQALLTPTQAKRLDELDLRWRGPLALNDDKVASQVSLTPDQQRQISNILDEYKTAEQSVRTSIFPPPPNGGQGGPGGGPGGGQGGPGGPGGRPQFDRAAFQARMTQFQTETAKYKKSMGDKVLTVLTPEQKQTWKTLVGKPFTFSTTNTLPPRTATRRQVAR